MLMGAHFGRATVGARCCLAVQCCACPHISDEMRSTVVGAAERLQGPASRGLPEQFRVQMRWVCRARASSQNRKFETPAGTPISGCGGEVANPSGAGSRAQRGFVRSHEKAMASFKACFFCMPAGG